MPTASILSVGDELVAGEALDTNGQWISASLARRGIRTVEHRAVGDDRALIAAAMADLARRCDVVVVTGGLGPTDDDLTRFALADVVDPGCELVEDRDALEHLHQRYAARGRMPPTNLRQTLRPPTARMLPNPSGTALGLAATAGDTAIFLLPGPPNEMMPMLDRHVLPDLPGGDAVLVLRTVHCFGLGESGAAERLGELTRRGRDPQVGITVSSAVVTARIRTTARSEQAALDEIEPVRRRVIESWKPYVFGEEDDTLPAATGRTLADAGVTLATAESCTGGWLGKLIVDVGGSSAYYHGGWITYTNELKTRLLDVDPGLIQTHGAVSEHVARAMAIGARRRASADHALSITGVAGPGGGTPDKPPGTVYVALASAADDGSDDDDVEVRRFALAGDRAAVRHRSALSALQMLRFRVIGAGGRLLWESE